MSADRRVRLWSMIVAHADGRPVEVEHVCAAVIATAGVDSVAVAVALNASPHETIYASDPLASELEELTLTLGEGPCADAFSGGPTLVADLTAAHSLVRWPIFAPAAALAGICAIFALPLQVGGVRLGVISLYRTRPGELGREQLADALALADTACALLLDARHLDQLEAHGQDGGGRPERVGSVHPEVHQATGMITVQLGVTAAVALIRLRAYAYAHARPLRDVAGDVVARRLRFAVDGAGTRGAGDS